MTLPRPTIVIFDMDGTTVRHVNPKLLHALEWLDDILFKIHRLWGMLLRRGDKATVYKAIDAKIDSYKARKKPRLIVHRALHKVRRKSVEQIVEPCPGIYAVLDMLRANAIPAGIVSNGLGKGYGHEVLSTFGLEDFFQSKIFREDITHSKPNPEAILLALDKMGAPVGANDVIWYIGDRHKDIRAARAAQGHVQCKIIPIAYGFGAALGMLEKNAAPDYTMMSWYEMYEMLCDLLLTPTTKEVAAA